ncbi:MAG: DUF6265 family protein [Acidobacteriota bacterium]|nr:DUF6265 family protein [Acidobacteriota bacterium]MDH3522888.1 DUF6265 family protein [Acidobacteriota bacterium]
MKAAALVAGLLAAGPAVAEPPPAIESLTWMCGAWGDPEAATEVWMAPLDGLMLGVNRAARPGQMPFFEFLRIEQRVDGIVFLASPLGREAVEFRLRELGAERVVFENPEHDFPQRIAYRLDGDVLSAEASAGDGEGRQVQTFRWQRRAACASAADSPRPPGEPDGFRGR